MKRPLLTILLCLLTLLPLAQTASAEDKAKRTGGDAIGYALVNVGETNFRIGAPLTGEVEARLSRGQLVYVFGDVTCDDGYNWYNVCMRLEDASHSQEGWIRGDLLTLTADLFTDIIEIASSDNHVVGLRSDGTVVAYGETLRRALNTGDWTDMVHIGANHLTTVGVKANGGAASTGFRVDNVGSWANIDRIVTDGADRAIGIRKDGTLENLDYGLTFGEDQMSFTEYTGIVDIGWTLTDYVLVREDGTAFTIAIDDADGGALDVDEWADIVAVACGSAHAVGLKSDGTVVTAGDNEMGQCDVADWTDIVAVASNPATNYTLGLRSDGTVAAAGENLNGRMDVGRWKDMVQVTANASYSVGLRSDGTVIMAGKKTLMDR